MITQTKNIKLIQLHGLYLVEIIFSALRPKYIYDDEHFAFKMKELSSVYPGNS